MQGRVGVEIGGTFTDLVWQRADNSLVTHKVLSTPEAIHEAVMHALEEAEVGLAEARHVVHGSTVATNALLTRRGAETGLLTTKGFRDVIDIGTHDRQGNVYEIFYRKPRSPIPRRSILEVPER
ncbi:MAG: hydantoinase/oxoprolinase N-terminal domain-containing protein, partial [Alphaproteobacteria bacterium]